MEMVRAWMPPDVVIKLNLFFTGIKSVNGEQLYLGQTRFIVCLCWKINSFLGQIIWVKMSNVPVLLKCDQPFFGFFPVL